MAYCNVWVHAVWITKNRQKIITRELNDVICRHIERNAVMKGLHILEINSHLDHVHCLFALRADWSIAKCMQMITGESAHWINQSRLFTQHFAWGNEYFACAVSKGSLQRVRLYIRYQWEHHRKMTFETEYQRFVKSDDSLGSTNV